MEARKLYEEEIMKRVKLLPDAQLAKVISMLDKIEAEEHNKKPYSNAIEQVWGLLSDGLSSSDAFAKRKAEEKSLDR